MIMTLKIPDEETSSNKLDLNIRGSAPELNYSRLQKFFDFHHFKQSKGVTV